MQKGVYDNVVNLLPSKSTKSEKRTYVEIALIKEQLEATNTKLFWTDGDQNIVDGLTKVQVHEKMLSFLRDPHIALQHNEQVMSAAKKRKLRSQKKEVWLKMNMHMILNLWSCCNGPERTMMLIAIIPRSVVVQNGKMLFYVLSLI